MLAWGDEMLAPDPKQLTKDMPNIGHLGNGDYQIQVDNDKTYNIKCA